MIYNYFGKSNTNTNVTGGSIYKVVENTVKTIHQVFFWCINSPKISLQTLKITYNLLNVIITDYNTLQCSKSLVDYLQTNTS